MSSVWRVVAQRLTVVLYNFINSIRAFHRGANMAREANVAIIGTKFMGKAHSNAWKNVGHFFDVPIQPVLKVACGQNANDLNPFAERWGWQETETTLPKATHPPHFPLLHITL